MSGEHITQSADWSELVRVALLGTHREPVPALAENSPLAGLVQPGAEEAPEQTLLKSAGAAFLYEQAGERPNRYDVRQVQAQLAGGSEGAVLSPRSVRYLRMLTDGTHGDLLPEFLARMQVHHLHVPSELLPDLLDRGQKVARIRPKVATALNQQGRWLAAQNRKWAYAATIPQDWDVVMTLWRAAKAPERQNLLRKLREQQPELGRQLIESVWGEGSGKGRYWYVKILEDTLTMDDEPFLERALNDRNATVRKKAAEFLSLLPESRFCGRMAKNSRDVLQWRPTHRHKILIAFPDEVSAEMIRDGVSDKKQDNMARIREGQLKHMLGAVPLDVWTEQWGVSAEDIVRTFGATNWTRTLTTAFATATKRQQHKDWARAFLSVHKLTLQTLPMVGMLSDAEFETTLAQIFELNGKMLLEKNDPLLRVASHWPRTFTPKMTDIYLQAIVNFIEKSEPVAALSPLMNRMLKRIALLIPVEQVDHVAVVLHATDAGPKWQAAIRTLLSTLRMREGMLGSLDADAARVVVNGNP